MAGNVITFVCEYVLFSLIWTNFGGICLDFGYDGDEGPINWGSTHNQCVGKQQSPINIWTRNVEHKTFPPLKFEYFDKPMGKVTLKNNGHTVLLETVVGPTPKLRGGPLKGVYKFMQLHFHWGWNSSVGSENLINQRSYPMELHVVLYNENYKDFIEATKHPDGLTVLSFLIELSASDNKDYALFHKGLQRLMDSSPDTTLSNFVSLDDFTTTDRGNYYTYKGSLTTPPCSEVVTWIEFVETVPLSEEQIAHFRDLPSRHGRITHNNRPPQPINNRLIYYNGAIPKTRESLLCISIGLFVINMYCHL